ncbi:hypothetical protein J4573_32780 [Actinomadura barringtoniae]|uniref:M28 family peptidase n=1 Tax=Actinomadura barringtoniae TaxID=1427535 RepID=A0A939PFH6_9ACTN|nr:hypothetical protein [Actinomadura barringtoniae]MBO2451902.1 hypothetical protein [Actinomadura barringtoniae]
MDLVDSGTLMSWVKAMSDLGPRFTGGHAHRRYVDLVEAQLRSCGLTVGRHPVPINAWEAGAWSLTVEDVGGRTHRLPSSYRPYSGQTSSDGVRGELIEVGAGQPADYEGKDVRGRVVVADYPLPRMPFGAVFPLADYIHQPEDLRNEDYTRLWQTVPAQLSLDLARQHGAIAMVDIIDLPPDHTRLQYSPHQQPQSGLPALHLDRVEGRLLRDLMRAPAKATVTLTAATQRTTIDYLTAELKGNGSLPGAVMVGTHTDGQNAIEENGVPAVLALARYFAALPQASRPRDVLFVLSPNHMTAHNHTPDLRTWLEQNPALRDRIVACLVPEHLGAQGWTENGPTDRSEPAVLGTGNSDALTALVIDQVKEHDLARTAVLKPFNDGLYGEATYPYRLGIPTATLISGPAYLVQVAPNGHLDRIDPDLMHTQTVFLASLLTNMLALPTY